MTKTNTLKYMLHKSYTKSIIDLNFKLTVGRSSSRVSRNRHSAKTESELTLLQS